MYYYFDWLAFRYTGLQEMYKDFEQKINEKMSIEMQDIQQTLQALRKRDQHKQIRNIVYNIKEAKQSTNNITCTDYKKANWYASLLMYNSY